MSESLIWTAAATLFLTVACPLLGIFAAYCDGVLGD